MKWGKVVALLLITAIIVGAAILAVNPLKKSLKLGLDLKGGVQVRLQAKGTVTDKEISQIIAIMRNRVDKLGVTEPVIQKEGENRILIELPGVKDPETAINLIGKTAQLEFKTVDGTTVLTGKDLADAQEGKDPQTGEFYVGLKFNPEGTQKFAEVTTQLVNQYPEVNGKRDERRIIAILLDEDILQAPYVIEPITKGEGARITGYKDLQEAHNIAVLLRSGALPVPVEIIEKRTVGPTLGADSIVKSKTAGIWGLVAIMVFMLLYYRVPGIIANISLVLYALIVLGILAGINATLTLPGIAGFLLSVGMCVDANIIIYERLKEELRNGKSLRAAIDAGFSRAFWTIFDANVTTLIAAAVLFYLGTGTIKGFAVTLSIGILSSMFTAITFTRYMLKTLADSRVATNPKLYGA
ncbi:MAG: protein translocase subunit SecD [Peptococcaceae bacterium]|nr:protein translocase subunit SecD [Peptococcaceae bacterium]MDH7525126.1 protein translocase subunit SecD [Peptococcaceae bacterium]